MFRRILIANRGEVAERIIRACRDFNIEPVPVYSEADSNLPYLKHIDNKICIGPGKSSLSYLNREAVLQAAINTEVQGIHPGYGFLAEDEIFARMCNQQKITFIGPNADSISIMGNKSEAKKTFRNSGLAVIPGSVGDLPSVKKALEVAEEIGFPIMLKATSGGGGRGIRICKNRIELEKNLPLARGEAEKNFGSSGIYMEKLIGEAKHIEFQILGDNYGNLVHLGDRECSIQRNNQKLIEETPSPSLDDTLRLKKGNEIINSLGKIGYTNAGTIEFLMDDQKNLYFMEMNTRLQVEHTVTEMVTGIDIVKEQFKIAANREMSLKQSEIKMKGHSIECRINAEDPEKDFLPSPGIIKEFVPDTGSGPGKVRIDTHAGEGYEVPVFYDSMIAKVIAHGDSRDEAIETMVNALQKFRIKGIKTTIPIHLSILNSEIFRSGNYNNMSLKVILGDQNG
ncbi:MAG: acetyl-CoA carboxylase biotin carboxylase subunit [Acidobacteriota bacterium]